MKSTKKFVYSVIYSRSLTCNVKNQTTIVRKHCTKRLACRYVKVPRLNSSSCFPCAELKATNILTSYRRLSQWGDLDFDRHHEVDWREIISEAERIVGYPTSFLNLRWLFNEDIAKTAIHLKKLVGTNHPVLKSTKNLLIGSKNNLQSVCLIILLVSKAAGLDSEDYTEDQYDYGVLHAQRAVAEIVELKRIGHQIYKAMINIQEKEKSKHNFKELYENKIVLLTGDDLFATCLTHLGGLQNNDVKELISFGLRDLKEGDLLGEHDVNNSPLPSQPKGDNKSKIKYDWETEYNLKKLDPNIYLGHGKEEWILRTMLTSGSLLGKGCQAAMKLSHRGDEAEKSAYMLGGHFAILWQIYLDVKDFFTHPHSYSLVGLPVIIALWEYPTIYGYILEAKLEERPFEHTEYKQLYYAVRGTRAMEYLALCLRNELIAILKHCEKLPVKDARTTLQKMAVTIHNETMEYIEK